MESGEDEVARFSRRQGKLDGLEVPHLADEYDVGVLTQGAPQGIGKAFRMRPQLTLVDKAFLGVVEKLDGVLDGEDVFLHGIVDEVHYRGKRRRFAAAGRPRDEDEALFQARYVLEYTGQVEFIEGGYLARNGPEDRRFAAVLLEDVDPEAGQVAEAEGEVELEVLLEDLPLEVAQYVIDHIVHIFLVEGRQIDLCHFAVYPDHRGFPGTDVQVRSSAFECETQQFRYVHGVLLSFERFYLLVCRQILKTL
ncbi:MAG: hypothetical protein A4E60_02450 [Syntrophorhabdus sp. PtaB.Bin047]|nr:MAG: hypothetical protein A4E60_02450 [Syntrophorhabdus sp. PtaB.Bin047]